MLKEIITVIISTLGFGIIFNIKGKNLIFASLGGGLGWLAYKLSFHALNSLPLSFFISAIIFSSYSEILARILKTPVTTFIICALIPLVPGGGMYYTMYEIVKGNIDQSLQLGINTLTSAGALSLGIIFVSTITKLSKGSIIQKG
ncbi:MAG: threonine/serine exporter family protein [Clostridiaceae bacterium]